MSGFPTSIKITQLPNIGNGLNYQSLFPVVDIQGTPTTDKANLQIIGNLILTSAGGSYFPPASQAILAQSVTNTAQPNITSVGTLTSLNVFGNITAGNISGANVISANYIIGNIAGNISVSNITGIGNIATVNLDGNISNVLSGAGTWVPLNSSGANIGNITFVEANISTNIANAPIQILGNGSGNINFKSNNAINIFSSNLNNDLGGVTAKWVDEANNNSGIIAINDSGFTNGSGNIQLYLEKNGVPHLWTFDNTGNLVLPGNIFSVKYANGTLVPLGGGGNGTPGGANTEIQFNNSGAFGGVAGFTFDSTTGLLTVPNANITGTLTAANFAFASGGNITGANVISANYFSGDGSNLTHINGANVTGVVGNANIANFANYAGNATVANTANSVAGANVTGTVANANFAQYSGTASSANTVAGANVFGQVAYANVANNVAGANVSGQVANALVAGTVYTNAQPNITSLGTLANLNVNGLANLGNVSNITITGGTNGYVLQTDGAGNLSWTAQSGAGNGSPGGSNTQIQFNNSGVFGGVAGFTFDTTANLLTVPNANITGTLTAANFALAAGGNITGANVISANYFSGDGSNLTNIAGANVTGVVANATYANTAGTATTANTANAVAGANVTGNVANANLAGYVTQNIQSNITQVGTLSNLDVTGTITGGNIYANSGTVAAQYLAGDGSNIANIAGGNIQGNVGNAVTANFANYAGNITVNAQPNITSLGTLANLNVNGLANLGAVSNVTITGGNSGYVLQTDGAGNLSWVAQSGNGGSSSSIANGASNVSIPVADGNVYVNANAGTDYQWNFDTTGALNFPTTANVTVGAIRVDDANSVLSLGTATGNVSIFPGSSEWVFGTDGNLNIPPSGYIKPTSGSLGLTDSDGNSYIDIQSGGIYLYTDYEGSEYEWHLDTSGNTTFPANGTANLGNLVIANLFTANYFSGDGSNLTNISGNAVTGNVGNALVANFANYAGNVTVNAQPNITSVGTLANLTVGDVTPNSNVYIDGAGNLTATGNVVAGNFTTSGSDGNISGANVVFANSFTSTGGVVDFATNNPNVQLGNVGNVHIAGGTSGYVLQTDGAGNLSWVAQSGNGGGATSNIANGTSNVSIPVANGNITMGVGGNANIVVVTSTGANINGLLTVPNTAGGATAVALGSPTLGNLVSNAVTLTTDSSVSNAIAQLNEILGKLVPPSPPNFPASQSIAIQGVASYRMTNYTQTDNTPEANKSVAGGTTVANVLRTATYLTSNVTNAGPGNEGVVTAELNGNAAGNVTLTSALNANGTYSNLVIYNNFDYHTANANIAPGFWSVFSAHAGGTVAQGWNEVYIADSVASNTNTTVWFYDSSNPGTPTFSSTTITPPASPVYEYSSTVPHYTNTNIFTLAANVNKLSGNMYPTSDTFVTGTAGGAFGTPGSVTYAAAGITTPLAQNLYVSSGNAAISTTSTIISGFGASNAAPSLSVTNSYNVGTQSYTTTLAANVLYKTGNVSSATVIQEANIFVGSTIGSGSGLAFRITNPGSTDTPVYTGSEAAFNSQTGPLQTYDATVVANLLSHDQTNYSTGHLPAGPNLSTGRSGAQYFTFKIVRTSVSKFNVKWSGNIAGLWVALPGSVIDSTSSANGWLDMSVAYAGAGIPGVNSPGNGSNGCALGGPAPINTTQANASITATFGTVSSSSTATNEIYVRIKLTPGQSVTALSLQTASN